MSEETILIISYRVNIIKVINKEEVYQQFYQETADFVMKKFQLTLDEAYSYINMNQSYHKMIEIKIAETIIETNL